MKTIWKFPIDILDVQTVEWPEGSKVVHIGIDPMGWVCLWAIVDPETPKVQAKVSIFGTGHEVPSHIIGNYVSSFVQGSFVWHVFIQYEAPDQ